MKNAKRLSLICMAMLMAVNTVPVSAYAAEENTPKEEVVYINLNADGSVKEINVVNIFTMEKEENIIDYGAYENVRNMTTTDEITYNNEQISIETQAGKLYYEGKMNNTAIPWLIEIHYYLNGKEYEANELAGKSGSLKILMNISKNEACEGEFFEGYALQASFMLNTKKCTKIKAEGATVANVGADKQLTYTILPGAGAEIEVTADVTEFEMDAIAVNGIKLNLDLEVDDSEIQSQIADLTSAVGELDEGAAALSEGTSALSEATETLETKVGELYAGVSALTEGAGTLESGLSQINRKSAELVSGAKSAYVGLCTAAGTALNAELEKNGMSAVTLTPDNYASVLNELLKQMDADAVYAQAYQKALAEVTAQVDALGDSIYIEYMQTQSEALYTQAASKKLVELLMSNGQTEKEAMAYLQTAEGQEQIAQLVAALTEEEKALIINEAAANLSEEQKAQIRQGIIEQMMVSEEATAQITAAVSKVSTAAATVSALKGQLDSYGVFYQGLKDYTSAVGSAASGVAVLKSNLGTLYEGTGELNEAVGDLDDGVKALFDGTEDLRSGTGDFVTETSGMDTEVSDEIDAMISSISGKDIETVSFVSPKNTQIDAVQFVIQTENIEIEEAETESVKEEETPTFWDKFFALFGM